MSRIKTLMIVLILTSVLALTGCDQWKSRNFGGSYTHELPIGEKLVNVTWKDDTLWYLTRPMTENDKAETYIFQADTVFGVFEGTVTIVESIE